MAVKTPSVLLVTPASPTVARVECVYCDLCKYLAGPPDVVSREVVRLERSHACGTTLPSS